MVRRRIKLNKKGRKILFIFSVMLLCTFYLNLIGLLEGQAFGNSEVFVNIVVQEGDTLWELAEKYGPKDQDIRKTIHEIKNTNKLNKKYLQPGDQLLIPQYSL